MTVRVLGALDIGDPPLSPRERTTLAVLVVRRPAAVSPAEIRLAGRDLTADEWKTYLSSLGPQHPLCART